MNCCLLAFFVIFCVVAASFVSGQSSTTCSNNNNLLLTPVLREKILNVLNLARNKLETGQLLLNNGKYALQAASLPDLTWSCDLEEELFNSLEESCDTTAYPNLQSTKFTWSYQTFGDLDADILVDAMLAYQGYQLTGEYNAELSRHNLNLKYLVYGFNQILALSDKAQDIACAIQQCNVTAPFNNNGYQILSSLVCKVSMTEELQFGDEIYQVSPSANYIPPTQDVRCPSSTITVEQREAILQKVNEVRSQTSQGLYPLENGYFALQSASPLLPLLWSCADENAMQFEKVSISCSSGAFFDAATEFQKIVTGWSWTDLNPNNMLNWWSEFGAEYFDLNSNFNFLYANFPVYDTQYPAAFTFSDKAGTIACTYYICHGSSPLNLHLICRVKPSVSIDDHLYLI